MKNFRFSTIIRNIICMTPTALRPTTQFVGLSIVWLKKMFAIFLVAAIFFNGFVPKSAEFKSNFMQAINCAIETQTNFLDKYAESVVSVTNGIANNIIGALNIAGLSGEKISSEKQATNKDEQKSEPINTSADNCVITGNNTTNQSEINVLKVKATNVICSHNEDLNIMNGNLKINCGDLSNNIGILFFILFSILVVRIKDTIAVLLNNNKDIVINRLG